VKDLLQIAAFHDIRKKSSDNFTIYWSFTRTKYDDEALGDATIIAS
jgi:hypothetical protein